MISGKILFLSAVIGGFAIFVIFMGYVSITDDQKNNNKIKKLKN